MNPLLQPLIRRAIVQMLAEVGGEHNDEVIALMLAGLGHRVARRDVRDELEWLAGRGLVALDRVDPYLVARVLADGRDVVEGRLVVDGVYKYRLGD